MRLLNKMFGTAEEINGHNRCPTYLYRWTLARFRWGKVYLHKFVGDDWSYDLHDHPKRFISVGLLGAYLEQSEPSGRYPLGLRRYRAPWVRTFPAMHKHRITTPWGNCWTLVIVLKEVRPWGFWHDGEFYPWKAYVEQSGGIADKMQACD